MSTILLSKPQQCSIFPSQHSWKTENVRLRFMRILLNNIIFAIFVVLIELSSLSGRRHYFVLTGAHRNIAPLTPASPGCPLLSLVSRLVTRAPGLGRNIYESRALGWPGALFVHIVNIKFHRTFAFTVGHICSVDNKSHETGPP